MPNRDPEDIGQQVASALEVAKQEERAEQNARLRRELQTDDRIAAAIAGEQPANQSDTDKN